jgi:hypothetical protein
MDERRCQGRSASRDEAAALAGSGIVQMITSRPRVEGIAAWAR